MAKKRLQFAMLFLFAFSGLFAQKISQEEALKKAAVFYGMGVTSGTNKSTVALKTHTPATPVLVLTGGNPDNPDYFVYNIPGGGFVIVAGDARMPEQILAYSPNGSFRPDFMPDALQAVLNSYSVQAGEARKSKANYNTCKKGQAVTLAGVTQVGPLLKDIQWNQEAPYNAACPFKTDGKTRYNYTGCGATCTAQLMKYWEWPIQGTGSYKNPNNPDAKTNNVNYSQQTYNWSLMTPTYGGSSTAVQKAEVAKLMAHVGNAINMIYREDGSATSIHAIPAGLSNYFNYSPNMQLANRMMYTDAEWFSLIKREIDNNRPLIHSGDGPSGGHLFVCDGYDSSGKIRLNYGWSGLYDGFYSLAGNLYPNVNNVLIGVRPDNIPVTDADDAAPQIGLVVPLTSSNYSPALGKAFNIGAIVNNYNTVSYTGELGIALYKGENMVTDIPLGKLAKTLGSSQLATTKIAGTEVIFNNISIPVGTPNGDYKLRMVVKRGTAWFPVVAPVADVIKEINVKISNGTASLSYPQNTAITATKLELISPIDVTLANNRAVVKFSIKNMNDLFLCKNVDISILATPNNSPVPTVWQRVTLDSLATGLTRNFEIKDVPVPPGTDVTTCRYYIAYNLLKSKPGEEREATSVPMAPFSNNFKTCQVPKETIITNVNFNAGPLPDNYIQYNSNWEEVDNAWIKFSKYYVFANIKARLVTPEYTIADDDYVIEWYMGNLYGSRYYQILYISVDGAPFSQSSVPVFNQETGGGKPARLDLSQYAGKKVRFAFEAPSNGYYMDYFRLLNIRNPKDIALKDVTLEGSAMSGQSLPLKITVKNNSAKVTEKIFGSYTIDGETVEEAFDTQIAYNDEVELTFSKQILARGKAGDVIPVKVHVRQEGEEEAQMDNNDASAQYQIVNFFPRKGFLVFKSTKIGCPGCQLVYSSLDDIEKSAPDCSAQVELWRDGAYVTKDFLKYTQGSTPSYYLNGVLKSSKEDLMNDINRSRVTMSPPAELTLKTGYESESSRKLTIQARCRFAMPVKGEYKVGFIVIENNLINTVGEISGTHPTAEKLTKNYVPVVVIGGSDGSLSEMRITDPEAKAYNFSCSYEIPAETTKRYRKDNMQVIGVLYGPNGEILNSTVDCRYLKLPETEGITYKPLQDYAELKRIYEVETASNDGSKYNSKVYYRATLPTGTDYKFSIEKSADWKDKNFRLVLNSASMDNRIIGEILYPDVNGVYSIETAQKDYHIRLEETADTVPSAVRDGGRLILSGKWTAKELNSLRLDYDYLTSIDLSGIEIPSGVTGLHTANPNLLIYTASQANIPASWKNVVKGNSAEKIDLTDGYLFGNAREFTANSITFQRKYPYAGWSSACLPFDITSLPEGVEAEEFSGSQGSTLSFKKIRSLSANVPYILDITTAGEKTFEAGNVTVPVTEVKTVQNGLYQFEGTYDNKIGTAVAGLYILSSDGTGFRKANATNTISPFRSYIRYTGDNENTARLDISHKEGDPVAVSTNESDNIAIRYLNNAVELVVKNARPVIIYGVDGSIVRKVELQPGANIIRNLSKGIYLIENQKVIIK